jgi:hypothetical protein
MAGADGPEVVRRWRDLAMRQQQLHLRAAYAVLAQVFAEMAGRAPIWKTGLEGFDMQESALIQGWRKEGIEQGALRNARAAVVKVLQARFLGAAVPEGVRSALEKSTDVQQLTDWLGVAALTASPADFERFLTSAD